MAHGERAIRRLKQLRSCAMPRNYELVFTTSPNKELCEAVRETLHKNSCLTQESAERIYND
jgi:hypothetical protein